MLKHYEVMKSMLYNVSQKTSPFIFRINQSKISRFQQFWCTKSWGNLRLVGHKFAHFAWKVSLHYLVKFRTACYRNMIRKCFDEEVKASNKNCKVNGSAFCFLYDIFFLCYFYSRSLYCFNRLFSSEKVAGSEKNLLLNGFQNGLAYATDTVRNDHHLPQHKLRVLFATGQWHRPTPSAELTRSLNQLLSQLVFFAFHQCGDIFQVKWANL